MCSLIVYSSLKISLALWLIEDKHCRTSCIITLVNIMFDHRFQHDELGCFTMAGTGQPCTSLFQCTEGSHWRCLILELMPRNNTLWVKAEVIAACFFFQLRFWKRLHLRAFREASTRTSIVKLCIEAALDAHYLKLGNWRGWIFIWFWL